MNKKKTKTNDDFIEELRESRAKVGALRPVIVTKFGIIGQARREASPEWPTSKMDVSSKYEHLRIAAADNIQQTSATKRRSIISDAAGELVKLGIQPGEIANKLMEDFPFPEWTILRYLPSEYKNPAKAKAGRLGGLKYTIQGAYTLQAETPANTVQAQGGTNPGSTEQPGLQLLRLAKGMNTFIGTWSAAEAGDDKTRKATIQALVAIRTKVDSLAKEIEATVPE